MPVLLAVAAVSTAVAQTTPPKSRLIARPISSDDITAYKLPSTVSNSGGLLTIGIGQAAHLEADLDIAVAAADITGVSWELWYQPSGSAAKLADSPLPANLPVFEPSDRPVYQVAGRKLLRPDAVGPYIVIATITTKTTTVTAAQTFFAAKYVGIATCTMCHGGGLADVKVPAWSKTAHAEVFKDNINGATGQKTYGSSCWGCHTVGFDKNKTLANGGFDDVMKLLGWTPPAATAPGNWDGVPNDLKNVANIQCENCHGPGSLHADSGGEPIAISINHSSGDCNQCHHAGTHHIKGAEWENSVHAVTTRDPSGTGRQGCVGCHTSTGFIQRMNAAAKNIPFVAVDTSYEAINCQACHDAHGQTSPDGAPHQIRSVASVTLKDGTVLKKGGEGLLCMNCHQARQNAATYVNTTPTSSHWGPHSGTQADMLAGVNGFTYGKAIPSSAHDDVVKDTCVTCHMQPVDSKDPALFKVGGHTFKPSMAATDKLPSKELVGACQNCHGAEVDTFDFPLFDYNNDGLIEGVQTEVQHLLDQLSSMLPPDNKPKKSLAIDKTWTPQQLKAAYNWQFVANDGSKGIHNTAYAVGLLKASIADLSGK